MPPELIEYNNEIKNVQCNPEAVAAAVKKLGGTSAKASECTTNIQAQVAERRIDHKNITSEYLRSMNNRLKDSDKERDLAKLLWLTSVDIALGKKSVAEAWAKSTADANKTVGLNAQETKIAAAQNAEAERVAQAQRIAVAKRAKEAEQGQALNKFFYKKSDGTQWEPPKLK